MTIMLGRSAGGSASSSWGAPDAEVLDPEQPATSKAAEHARITRSILLAKDPLPLLVRQAPALPEGLTNLILALLPVWLVTPASPGPQCGACDRRHELRRLSQQPD